MTAMRDRGGDVGRTATELLLGNEPQAPSQARRFLARALDGLAQETIEDAQLIVTELITNAMLHGAPPVKLRVRRDGASVRIEVEDCGRHMPVMPLQSADAMTGRGLALVSALASSWGVEGGDSGGKVVWVEPGSVRQDTPQPDLDVDAFLASWVEDDEASPEQLYRVRLGAVPTDLLIAAKAHIDNVVREFTLARTEGASTGVEPPPELGRLIETVTQDFASARAEIKRQALRAAEQGKEETELVLRQPAATADAGERYLAALDEADRYARTARLLTLETPPVHRVFRRWYVQALVDQLRAAVRGDQAPPPMTFPHVLADEVTRLATLRDAWDRLQLLQKVTGELTGAGTVEDIAATVVANAREFLGALSARVYVLEREGVLRSIASSGGTQAWVDDYDEVPVEADLPAALAVRTGQPLLLRNLVQLSERFPQLATVYPAERAIHVAPLAIGDHRLGAFAVSFPVSGDLDEQTQVAFVRALADALAQALERALAMAAAAEANDRLAFLADASVALSSSLDYHETVDAVATLLVPRLADWCVVQLMERGELRTVAALHTDPEKVAWANNMADRYPTDLDAPTGTGKVLRTGLTEHYEDISEDLIRESTQDPEHRETLLQLGMSSVLIVPLTGRSGTFGAITLIAAESGRRYGPADITFVEDVARRAALALETAQMFQEQSGRLADVTRVAEAAQHAILAPPPAQLGPVALSARYVSAAAEALIGGDLYEVVGRPGAVRLLIGDVRGKGLAAVRTATVVLGEFRAAAADVDDLAEAARQIDRRVRAYLGDEDFVTALLAEIADDGHFAIASCGHPPAVLASGGSLQELTAPPTLPLGLGADPELLTGRLEPGDRLLLYTDGVIEARDRDGHFVDLLQLVAPLCGGTLETVLDDVLTTLRTTVGRELGDDLALVVAEYRGAARG
jgi:serine phosphatase RsbU (regulator of sigma subunit)/anti-sigma regulatory factor (Ser/Thr protein kinase)